MAPNQTIHGILPPPNATGSPMALKRGPPDCCAPETAQEYVQRLPLKPREEEKHLTVRLSKWKNTGIWRVQMKQNHSLRAVWSLPASCLLEGRICFEPENLKETLHPSFTPCICFTLPAWNNVAAERKISACRISESRWLEAQSLAGT